MKHFVLMLFLLLGSRAFAAKSDTPYIVPLSPDGMNQVRVNIEQYKPTPKAVVSYEIDFGDGSPTVNNLQDVYHTYSANGAHTLTVKTWDKKNVLTTYTKVITTANTSQIQDIPGTSVLGPVAIDQERLFDIPLNNIQAARLYMITITRNAQLTTPPRNFCNRDFNVTINKIEIFQEAEINCMTTQIRKFIQMDELNALKFKPQWSATFVAEIHAVSIITNPDTVAPVVSANVSSGARTKNPLIHISVSDASAATTYVWDGQQNLLITQSSKEFDIPMSEGANSFVVQSVDASGNQSSYLYLTAVVLDTAPPDLNVLAVTQNIYSSYPQNVTFEIHSSEELAALTVNNFNATLVSPGVYNYVATISGPGEFSMNLKAFDLAGNEKILDYSVSFGLDNVAPVLSANLANNSYTKDNNLNISVTDNSSVSSQVFRDGVLILTSSLNNFNVPLIEGANNLVVKSSDQYGNQALDLNLVINYDTHAPELISDLEDMYYLKSLPGQIEIGFASNEVLSSFEADGQVIPLTSVDPVYGQVYYFYKAIISSSGNQLVVKATDLAGNVTSETHAINIQIDNTPPVLTPGSFQTPTTADTVTIPMSIFDAGPVTTDIYVNQVLSFSGITQLQFSKTFSLPNYQIYVFEYRATDAAGNTASRFVTVNRKPDITPPTITINNSGPYYVASLPGTINVQVTSSEILKRLTVNGTDVLPITSGLVYNVPRTVTSLNGNSLNIVATDLYDNPKGQVFPISVVLDNTAPVITLGSFASYTDQSSVLLPVNISDSSPVKTEISVNQVLLATVTETNFSYLIPLPADGEYAVSLKTTDSAGNISFKNITLARDSAPLALQIQSPQSGNIYDDLTVNVRFNSTRRIAHAYVNNVEVPVESDMKSVNYYMQNWNDGLFTVTIKVDDQLGGTITRSVNATIKLGGAASWSYEECPVAGEQ